MDYKISAQLALLLVIYFFCFAIGSAEDCPADKDKDWTYNLNLPNGPLHWGEKYPNCNGTSQSPINIITRETVKSGERQRLELHGYDEPIGNVTIENIGSAILVWPQDGVERSVMVDGEKFTLLHVAFHWGNETHKGSEDSINGRKFTISANLIHQNNGKSVSVVAFLEERRRLNSALYNILSVKEAFQYEGQKFEGEIQLSNRNSHRQGKIYLGDLIDNNCPFYRYEGSLSFPPCDEGLTWMECRKPKTVNRNQMNQLFSLYSVKEGTPDADKCHLLNNYRPAQPLNGRKVYR
ncbi:carbonic anhydrase 1-like isoform X2 [Parasteatoda tepidariorum]|uniref:carbonic anhydrase 1-like isoform X2 n=1 Tax=Parasteatoda tepidariorum TaxID=114398 RepID=UPI001C718056|nr:carbonic anhydrase 1-like [Parasteatoda tepidariorum]